MKGDDDRFRVRPGAPKSKPPQFVSQVIREVSKAGGKAALRASGRPGARLGRGHAASRIAGRSASPTARRVSIKTRLVNLSKVSARSTATHLRYIERDGIGRAGEQGRAYGPDTDEVDLAAFEARGREDRHQFRFIVSAEDGEQLGDLRRYTRGLMTRMEGDLGTRLEWVAVDHWDTDNPHTHIVLRGKDEHGRDLVIAGDYLAHGMRGRANELATEWLGPRSEREIELAQGREAVQERWTSLDRTLQQLAVDGEIRFEADAMDEGILRRRSLLVGRLQQLEQWGLAERPAPGVWAVKPQAEPTLRAMGERGDIVRTMQRAMGERRCEFAIVPPGGEVQPVVGRVVAKGLADELNDCGYLVIDGIDGRAHHVTLGPYVELRDYPVGAIVEVRAADEARAVDRGIVAATFDGIYRAGHRDGPSDDPATARPGAETTLDAQGRRLEALRRVGLVERIADGVWRVPPELIEYGRRHNARQLGGARVEPLCHLPIERQVRAIGATWLDRQLLGGGAGLSSGGFGGDASQALKQRADFLVEQGLANRRSQRLVLARNLLATLRERELAMAAQAIETETRLLHQPVAVGHRVSGVYRRQVQLVSGRFAMLDTEAGFSLVPWRPVIEKRLGQSVTAELRQGGASWSFGRQRGLAP